MSHDASPIHSVAGWVGHAGPKSSLTYMHLYERALARHTHRARPSTWAAPAVESDRRAFPPLDGASPEALGPPMTGQRRLQAGDLDLEVRRKFAWTVARGAHLASASASLCAPHLGPQVTTELVEALLLSRMVGGRAEWTMEAKCDALAAYTLWARAAKQGKHRPLAAWLDREVEAGRLSELAILWQAWSCCRAGEHLSMEIDRPARRLLDFLLAAGVPRTALLLVQDNDRAGPGNRVAELRLPVRKVEPRPGRSAFRLQWSESDTPAAEVSGAALSMLGLHWHFVVLGSFLLAKGVL